MPTAALADVLELEASEQIDSSKRTFLRLAGLVGLGVVASQAFPDKAKAFVLGGNPSSTVIGVKNASNTRINPATEDTLALVQAQTTKLTFDGSNNLYVQAASNFASQLENGSNVVINPATQDTLALIKAQTDKFTFDGSNYLQTTVGGTGNIVGLKDTTSTQINPATDDSLVYLRRIVKIMESQGSVDGQNRQRVSIDSWGLPTGPGTSSGLAVPRVSVATDSAFNAAITSINTWDRGMFIDPARTTYSVAMRAYLAFS